MSAALAKRQREDEQDRDGEERDEREQRPDGKLDRLRIPRLLPPRAAGFCQNAATMPPWRVGGGGTGYAAHPMGERTILTLIRHGETSANLDGVWHGSTDTPLTERGLQQALRVAKHVAECHADAAALYTSDLQRARETARAIGQALALPLVLDARLREYDLGEWEGKTYLELHEEHRLWHHMKRDPDFAPHGGESPRQVTDRFMEALRRIAAAHPGERVLVVAHGGALAMALGALLDGDGGQWRRVMDNCAVSELVIEPKPELLSFNHTSHLAGV